MTTVVDILDLPSAERRDAIRNGPVAPAEFAAAFASLACLHQVEQRSAPRAAGPPPQAARIVFWNAERLKYPAPTARLLAGTGAEAHLICEVDCGMARSGNRHAIADLASAMGAGWVYGVEFVELDLGDARERRWHAGQANAAGLHGAGLVSPRPLDRPQVVRLETSGRWFDGAFGERRVGGRMAVMAELELATSPVLLVCVHYESHGDPEDRLAETCILLDAIDRRSAAMPVLIGGDFNTSTFDLATKDRAAAVAAALAEVPGRLVRPMAYEPMFGELATRGYDWEGCNTMGRATQRTRPDGTPRPPFGRIDWFFSRGLACSDPETIAAVDEGASAISDHDALAVTIRPVGA